MRTRCEEDAAHHAVATHTAMMSSRRSPDVTAAAVLLVSPACAMHPLALHITLVLRQIVTCAQTAQLVMTAGLITQGRAVNLVFNSCCPGHGERNSPWCSAGRRVLLMYQHTL